MNQVSSGDDILQQIELLGRPTAHRDDQLWIHAAAATSPARVRRIGDVERTATCDALADHFAAGRLDRDELEHRVSCAVEAVTDQELRHLTADLPGVTTAVPQPMPRWTWPATTVLAVVTLVVSVVVAGGLLLILGLVNPLLFLAASFGGFAAATGGASALHLVSSWQRSVRNNSHH